MFFYSRNAGGKPPIESRSTRAARTPTLLAEAEEAAEADDAMLRELALDRNNSIRTTKDTKHTKATKAKQGIGKRCG